VNVLTEIDLKLYRRE